MATEEQIAANRRNAELSSGPKTEAGRNRSRMNALRHGLTGQVTTTELVVTSRLIASPTFVAAYLPFSATEGATIIGQLTIAAPPIAPTHATNKAYVDAAIAELRGALIREER